MEWGVYPCTNTKKRPRFVLTKKPCFGGALLPGVVHTHNACMQSLLIYTIDMATQKTFYLTPKQVKLVDRLAKKLKVSESQVVRDMIETYSYDLWLDTLKIKNEQAH